MDLANNSIQLPFAKSLGTVRRRASNVIADLPDVFGAGHHWRVEVGASGEEGMEFVLCRGRVVLLGLIGYTECELSILASRNLLWDQITLASGENGIRYALLPSANAHATATALALDLPANPRCLFNLSLLPFPLSPNLLTLSRLIRYPLSDSANRAHA